MGLGIISGTSVRCNRPVADIRVTNGLLRLAPAIFLAIATLLTVLPGAAAAQSYTFNAIRVDGNQRIEAATIIEYAGIARGEKITAGALNDAYQRVLDSGVFETVEFDPRGSTLTIHVKEFPTINVINFEGNKRLDDDKLAALVESASRRVFNPAQADRDAAKIAEAYAQQGRIAATVTPRIIRRSDNRVDLVFEISEGTTIEIERISFVGNHVFSDRRLRRVMGTKQAGIFRTFIRSDTLIEDRIDFDKQVLRDFYLSRGYIDFRITGTNVELTHARDAFFLVFNVEEGQQFRFGKITTTSEVPEAVAAEFQAALKIKPGVVYSPSLVESSMTRMERLSVEKGINFLRIEPRITRNERDLSLDVEFVLTRGPRVFVERIDISGNTTTLDRVVRQQFRVVEGDPFNPREIRQSAERIRALGFFANTDVQAREGSTPDKVVIDVKVEEKPTGSLSLGGSYSVSDGIGVALGLSESNFLGRGQRLSFKFSNAQQNREYILGFAEPNLLGRDLLFSVDVGYSAADSNFTSYDSKRTFFQPSLTFPVSENGHLTVRYGYVDHEMLARVPPTNGVIIGNEIASGAQVASSIGIGYRFDSRLTGLNPNAGVLFEINSDLGGVGGDSNYLRTTAKATAQTKILNEEVTLTASLEGGALKWQSGGTSRAIDRFVLGPSIMRGFDPSGIGPREITATTNDALGGNFYAVARLEARFPLGLPDELGLSGALFYDIGNLWNLSNTNQTGVAPGSIVGAGGSYRQVLGFGLLWDSGFGPLRLNFTKALSKEIFDNERSFEFTVSTKF